MTCSPLIIQAAELRLTFLAIGEPSLNRGRSLLVRLVEAFALRLRCGSVAFEGGQCAARAVENEPAIGCWCWCFHGVLLFGVYVVPRGKGRV